MNPPRKPLNPVYHFTERLQARIMGNGWPARIAHMGGRQHPPEVLPVALTLAAPAPMPPLRIAFASDFHAGPTTHPAVIEAACARIAAMQPDLVLLGGDYVSFEHGHVQVVAQALRQIHAPLGMLAVLGNHDIWAGERPIIDALEAVGVTVLVNAHRRLPAPYAHVWVCGLDDPSAGTPDSLVAMAGADGTRIVLMHAPIGLESLVGQRYELALCGHTHGGQICWPGGVPVFMPQGGLNRRYAAGRFQLTPATTLLVSRGVGYGGIPLRAYAPADMLECVVHWQMPTT